MRDIHRLFSAKRRAGLQQVGKSEQDAVSEAKIVVLTAVEELGFLAMGRIGLRFVKGIIVGALGVLFSVSCHETKHRELVGGRIIYPLSDTKLTMDLSQSISDLELISIVADSLVNLSGIKKMLVANDKYFCLSGGVVYEMSKDGSLVRRVGNVGRGPGEYLSVKDIVLNVNGEEVWCLDIMNKILKYSINDGSFLSVIDLGRNIGHPSAVIPLKDDAYSLYLPNPFMKDMAKMRSGGSYYCLPVFDKDGKRVRESLKWIDYNIEALFSVPCSSSEGKYVLAPSSSSPAIVYMEGVESEQLFFDFGRKTLPRYYAFERGDDPMMMLENIFEDDYYKLISYILFIKDSLYFCCYGKESSLWNFYYSADGTTGIRWKSIGMLAPPIHAVASEDGYLFFPYDDYGMLGVDQERDPLKRCVLTKYGKPQSPNVASSYLIKVKFNV